MSADQAARLQFLAMEAGLTPELSPDAGRQVHDYRLKPAPLNATFHYYAWRALACTPECLNEDM